MRIILGIALALATGLGVAFGSDRDTGVGWDRLTDHPLNGTIWTGSGDTASWEMLAEAAAGSHFVLIGENHDNADHHRFQARLIGELTRRGRRPAVVFEMIPAGMQAKLDAYLTRPDATAAGLGQAVGWERLGWPAWETYQPIAETAMATGLRLVAGGLGHGLMMRLGRHGSESLPHTDRTKLALDVAFPTTMRDSLLEELRIAHCDLMPLEALDPMVAIQRARDGMMARALLSTAEDGAVLVAGKGHARGDRGVPYVLRQLGTQTSMLTIALVGVEPAADTFADYSDTGLQTENGPLFEFIVFTDRAKPVDHCATLRERYSGASHHHPEKNRHSQ